MKCFVVPGTQRQVYAHGTRSRGRQPNKWIDNVKGDPTLHKMNMREAVDNSKNRKILEKSC